MKRTPNQNLLPENGRTLQSILDNTSSTVTIFDLKGRILLLNKAAEKVSKQIGRGDIGKSVYEILPKKTADKVMKDNREVIRKKKLIRVETTIPQKDGDHTLLSDRFPLYDSKGKTYGICSMGTDVTERKKTEEKIKHLNAELEKKVTERTMELTLSEERWKFAVEGSNDALWDWNIASHEVYRSKRWNEILGAEENEIEPTVNDWKKRVHPHDIGRITEELQKHFRHETPFLYTEYRILCRNGSYKWIMDKGKVLVWNKDGSPARMIGTHTDITQKKEAEEKLIKAEMEIRSFAGHLNKTMEDERASIAREIHDEFGQKLAGIKVGLSSFKKLFSEDNPLSEKMNDMMRDVDNTLQALRKIATELRPGILDTLGLIPSIHWLVSEFEKKTKIKCRLNPDINQHRYEQNISTCFFRICQETLTNISKHSGASEVVIDVKEEKDTLTLKISDNGKGISSEKLENPFSMGLLGMRERANIIGGHLLIMSKKDEGTTIQLKAPALKGEMQKEALTLKGTKAK